MQDVITLKPRETGKGAARACRRSGLVPGVIYGKATPSMAVALDAQAVKKIMTGAGSHVHHVVVETPHFEGDVMVQDAVYDPINGRPVHVDLHSVSMTEKVRTEVPIVVSGESGLAKRGLILQRQMRDIMVECLPGDIPDSVSVSVGDLEHSGTVTAGGLHLPQGVRLLTAPTEVLVVAVLPRAVEEEKEEEKPAAEGAEAEVPAEVTEKGEKAEKGEKGERPERVERPERTKTPRA